MKLSNIISYLFSPLLRYSDFIKDKIRYRGKLSFIYGCKIGRGSSFEGCNTLGDNCEFSGSMGYGSYMSSDCKIDGNIGRFTSIGPEVICPRGIHPYKAPYVATSPMFFSTNRITGRTFATRQIFKEWKKPITIGNDCWIGARVMLTGGITIGDGTVIYSNAVVTKDTPPYSIVAGIPAHVIGYRYEEETIRFLMKLKWWDKGIEWLQNNWELLNDINKLKEARHI